MISNHKAGGYVTLLAVIIVGSFSLAVATVLLRHTADTSKATTISINSVSARNMADACIEEALQQIHDDLIFSGTGNLTFSQGNCSYTVSSTGKYTRKIKSLAKVNENVYSNVDAYVKINVTDISVTSWQEVTE